jgi:hypothetical protein
MSSGDPGSISRLLIVITESDDRAVMDDAVRAVWERYFDRLVRLARKRLRHAPSAMRDAEDVALSAINGFCRRAADGQFPRLDDRQDLWRILMTIAVRKAAGFFRHPIGWTQDDGILNQIVGREPSPELAATVADEVRHLLESLPPMTVTERSPSRSSRATQTTRSPRVWAVARKTWSTSSGTSGRRGSAFCPRDQRRS